LNGGTSPTLQWNTLIAQTRTVILRDGALVQPSLSLETPNAQADLEVLALGTGLVSFNGQRIDRWDGHLPRLLLFFAVDRGSITRDDFQRAFWNGVNTAKATNVFHVTKRRLHRSLDFELLEHKAGSYRIHPDISVYYDAKAWMNALSTARAPLNPDPTRDYATVLALYRGAFLKGNTESWVISRRQDFLAGYLEAIIHTAAHYAQKFFDDPLTHHTAIEKAASLYDEALREAPYHPQVILAYAQLLADPRVGRRIEALYTLQAYLTTSPAPQDPLFERILALNQRLRGA
jgi:two-component SAPR family response regulator